MIAALCFLIFINDLPNTIKESFTGIFADDTLIAKEIRSLKDTEDLQDDIKHVEDWASKWGMIFNADKCVKMTVTNKRTSISRNYKINNEIIKDEDKIKYLGVIIDKKITFKEHIEIICKKAQTVLNMIRRNLYFAPKNVKKKACMATVIPILEYASICWSPSCLKLKKRIEIIQNNCAKFVTNLYPKKGQYQNFSVTKILNSIGWDSLESRRQQARLTMAYKILNNQVILMPEYLPKNTINRPTRKPIDKEYLLEEKHSRIDQTQKTFFYSVPTLWNNTVTAKQAKAKNVDIFKKCFHTKNKTK